MTKNRFPWLPAGVVAVAGAAVVASYVVPALEQRYQRDERFRDQVDRYVAKFETLQTQSQQVDPESVLSAAFITADVGKLYLILAKSLGRPVEH